MLEQVSATAGIQEKAGMQADSSHHKARRAALPPAGHVRLYGLPCVSGALYFHCPRNASVECAVSGAAMCGPPRSWTLPPPAGAGAACSF